MAEDRGLLHDSRGDAPMIVARRSTFTYHSNLSSKRLHLNQKNYNIYNYILKSLTILTN